MLRSGMKLIFRLPQPAIRLEVDGHGWLFAYFADDSRQFIPPNWID